MALSINNTPLDVSAAAAVAAAAAARPCGGCTWPLFWTKIEFFRFLKILKFCIFYIFKRFWTFRWCWVKFSWRQVLGSAVIAYRQGQFTPCLLSEWGKKNLRNHEKLKDQFRDCKPIWVTRKYNGAAVHVGLRGLGPGPTALLEAKWFLASRKNSYHHIIMSSYDHMIIIWS